MNPYNDQAITREYLDFLNSENGQIQQQVLAEAIENRIDDNLAEILDAACGSGWLTGKLFNKFSNVQGCDGSEPLIQKARSDFPNIQFTVADLTSPLPYQPLKFDYVILNMAILDLDDPKTALAQIIRALKQNGKLIITLPNPYYNYPLGVWKAGALGKLLLKKPTLKLEQDYFSDRKEKNKTWGSTATSFTKTLEEYVNGCLEAGFSLTHFEELKSETDSKKFNLQYQLHRFPLLLLLEFKKVSE